MEPCCSGEPWRARPPRAGHGAPAFALAVLYAITDELHQGLVAGRHLSVVDVGIDAAGALIALVVVGLIGARRS